MNSHSEKTMRFYVQTILLSWIPWILAILFFDGIQTVFGKILLAIGGIGPLVSALILVFRSKERDKKEDYWKRLKNFKLISGKGLMFLFLLPVFSVSISVILSTIMGGNFSQFLPSQEIQENVLRIIPFAIFILFLGPIPEELGWRGFWLDNLKVKFNGLSASIIIATGWSIWHLPLFFMQDYPLQEFTGNAYRLAVYFLLLFPLSIIYTYVFYLNNRSTISAILFHFMINFTGTIIEIDLRTEWIQFAIYTIIALILIYKNPSIYKKDYIKMKN